MNQDNHQGDQIAYEHTPIVSESTPVIGARGAMSVVRQKTAVGRQWWLIDEKRNKEWPLDRLPCVIGRHKSCQVVIKDKGVSRQHAEIFADDDSIFVRDLGSTNGIHVNHKKFVESLLREGDIVGIGNDYEFKIEARAAPIRAEKPSPLSTGDGEGVSVLGVTTNVQGKAAQFPSYASYHQKNAGAAKAKTEASGDDAEHDDEQDDEYDLSLLGSILRWVVFLLVVSLVAMVAKDVFVEEAPELGPASKIVRLKKPIDSGEAEPDGRDFVVHPVVTNMAPLVTAPESLEVPTTQEPSSFIRGRVPTGTPGSQTSSGTNSGGGSSSTIGTNPLMPGATPYVDELDKRLNQLLKEAESNYLAGNGSDAILILEQAVRQQQLSSEGIAQAQAKSTLYRSLLDQYVSGDQLYKRGDSTEAFRQWAQFVKDEKKVFGDRKSAYAKIVGRNVASSLMSRANDALRQRQYHKAWRLWKKADQIGADGRAKRAMQDHEAKSLGVYQEAVRMEKSNPDQAIKLFRQVEKLLPPDHEYSIKASGKIDLMRNWTGDPIQ